MSDVDEETEEVKFELIGIDPEELSIEEFTEYMLQSVPQWRLLTTNNVFDEDTIFNKNDLNDQVFRKR